MSFEGAVAATGALTILLILAAHFSRNTKEPEPTLTRLEQKYFEPEVYAAQQADDAKAERLRQDQIDAAYADLARRAREASYDED